MPHSNDEKWMQQALQLADTAQQQGEVPVGAVVVYHDTIIGRGHNCPIAKHDPSAHAEIQALRAAGQAQQNYRLVDCTLYVTLEPCAMCVGAMLHARIARLVFAASDPKTGAVISATPLLTAPYHNHHIEVTHGVLAEKASQRLTDFFKQRRQKR